VSVLLFGIAGWESAKHGLSKLTASGHGGHAGTGAVEFLGFSYDPGLSFDPVYVSYTVLLGAFAFETYALLKARAEMQRQMARHDWDGYAQAFRQTSDVTTLTALTEDAIALTGIVLAFAGLVLEQATGNPAYDAAAAFGIGLMLMGFALALAWENKRLLLGESMPAAEEAALRGLVSESAGVEEVLDFRTVYFGPERIVVTADVAFADDLDTEEMDDRISAIETALTDREPGIKTVYIEPET
jgi:divalent metal cation (Fe/Co/Zn/Cd) transporter